MSLHYVSVQGDKSQSKQGNFRRRIPILIVGILLVATTVQAQLPTVVNGGFETGDFDPWFHRTAYCWVRGATGGTFPDNTANIRACRVLPLGQAIDAIVFHDVAHIEIAANDVCELTHTD